MYLLCTTRAAGIDTGTESFVFWYFLLCLPADTLAKNWRAAVTLLCSVTPSLPGLIGNINPNIKVGGLANLFAFSWLFGVCCDWVLFAHVVLIGGVVLFGGGCLLGTFGAVPCAGDVYGQCGACLW